LGATEQKFNILVHREIQREYGLAPQVVFTMPILVGLDGERKMSKSLGNYVGVNEPPAEMFGKLMSIRDDLMWTYYELVTDRTRQEIAELQGEVQSGRLHPMDAKMRLAKEVVKDFHGSSSAELAESNFQRVFRDRQAPEEMNEIRLLRIPGGLRTAKQIAQDAAEPVTLHLPSNFIKWSKLLADLGLVASATEAERIIKQKGFEIDGRIVLDPAVKLDVDRGATYRIRIGKKKFVRVVVE